MPGLLYPLIYGTKYSASTVPDLTGSVVIVTGGNAGIGFMTTVYLVRAGAKVYMGARSEAKANEAIAKINAMKLKGQVIWLKLDLMDFASARSAAQEFSNKEERLDVLFNNAGINGPEEAKVDADGLEATIKTNHFAPFLFTHLLLPKLQKATEPRIVMTSSTLYERFKVSDQSFSSVAELNQPGTGGLVRYNQSKFANLLFAMQLAKEYPNILSNACHPGIVATDMTQSFGDKYGKVGNLAMKGLLKLMTDILGVLLKPTEGALTQVYLGTAPEVAKKHLSGEYFVPIGQLGKKTKDASPANAERLWLVTLNYFQEKNISLKL